MEPEPEPAADRIDGQFEYEATRQSRRVTRVIVSVAAILAMCLWGFIALSLWSEYNVASTGGRTQGYNLTAALAGELSLTFDRIDSEIDAVGTAVRSSEQARNASARLASLMPALIRVDADLRIIGPDGFLLISTVQPDPGPADYSDTPHFQEHRASQDLGLHIGQTVPGPSGKPRMEVSRRINTPDGRFAGEVVLLLKPDTLIRLNREIDIGGRGMVTIVGEDGVIRAGYDRDHPDGSVGVGTDLTGAPYPGLLPPNETASYVRKGRVDGIDRLVTLRRLQRHPVNVLVALDMNDVLGPARTHVWLIGLIGVASSGLIAVLTILLIREVWRRTRHEIELSIDRDRLRTARAQIEIDRTRLARTNLELIASKEAADAANRAKSQFLAHMSHELRTPLHAIIGFSELIKDQTKSSAAHSPVSGYATDIWTSGRHLLELINSILDISKVESGTARLAESVVEIMDVARQSLVSIRGQAEARGVTIELSMSDPDLRLWADRTRIQQILINLLSNAVKFTPDKGRIVLSAGKISTDELVLCVTDSGIGMTDPEMDIAMQPFGQVDNALSRSYQGTGLGLPLARRLVELHGGRLVLSSIKGHGTTATVFLPAERLR
jgi:signal transduction histidine kinase